MTWVESFYSETGSVIDGRLLRPGKDSESGHPLFTAHEYRAVLGHREPPHT